MQIVLDELRTTKQEKEQLLDKLNESLEELENSKGLIEIHQAQHQSVSFCNNSNYKTKQRKSEVALWPGMLSSARTKWLADRNICEKCFNQHLQILNVLLKL